MNDKEIEKLAKNIYKALTNTITDNQNEISQAIALLEQNGYTLIPPYLEPTDEEIIARINYENEQVSGFDRDKCYICYKDNYWKRGYEDINNRILGVTYTTQSIAQQIVAELNEKRLVRV